MAHNPARSATAHPHNVRTMYTVKTATCPARCPLTMITVTVQDNNPISQDHYDSVVNSLQLHQLTCSCGHSACFCIHGYYWRSACLPDGKIRIRILRVKCTECGSTHAILLSSIVPYSQILLSDQCLIIIAFEQGSDRNAVCSQNPLIDENNVKSVIRRYVRHWLQKLLAESIPLSPVSGLVRRCFAVYSMQFMQIHGTFNCLYSDTT